MRCECPECTQYGGPDPKIMGFRFLILALQALVAVVGLIEERSTRALAVLLGAIAFFFTLPRYLICARCEGYGEKCYPFYLGKVTSLYIPRVESKGTSPVGAGLEGLTLSVLAFTPMVGLRGNRKLLLSYCALAILTLGLHAWHACRHCALYAEDWRKDCPGAKLARSVFPP